MILFSILSIVSLLFSTEATVNLAANPPEYGVDCSYPIHHGINKKECPYFYDRYQRFLQGCYKTYSKAECDNNERDRLQMNLAQPKEHHNYTAIGFKHIKAPKEVWDPIFEFYEANKANPKEEKWYRGSTIVNSWESPTSMVSFENPEYKGGWAVKQKIWDSVKPIIEEWVGRTIEPTSLYGIRIYTRGAVLATRKIFLSSSLSRSHPSSFFLSFSSLFFSSDVDRLPLVSSAIINVDQDTLEPWPVEVYDHSGKAYNVTMEPGDMVLYESHTVLHGRPHPLNGSYYVRSTLQSPLLLP